jgi:hypothetical protein
MGKKEFPMSFNGVELLRMQFSRAVEQTFESFLDSWSLPVAENPGSGPGIVDGEASGDLNPVIIN